MMGMTNMISPRTRTWIPFIAAMVALLVLTIGLGILIYGYRYNTPLWVPLVSGVTGIDMGLLVVYMIYAFPRSNR